MINGQIDEDGKFCVYKYIYDTIVSEDDYNLVQHIERIKKDTKAFTFYPPIDNLRHMFVSESTALLHICKYLFSNETPFTSYTVCALHDESIKYVIDVCDFRNWYASLDGETIIKCTMHKYFMNTMFSLYLCNNNGPLSDPMC
jgi:hypothetical protein